MGWLINMNRDDFENNDPFRLWKKDSERLQRAKDHWILFPYDSVYNYGATDRLHAWYRVMCEILGEKAETDTSCVDEV